MSAEVLLAVGYVVVLLAAALILEWLSAHAHKRSRRYRTSGFDYDEKHDYWVCHQGEQLWPKEYDRERRLVRYRAKPAVCRACEARDSCTDDPDGREITRAIDPWPHSEAGRFHRGIAVLLVGLGLFVLVVASIRHHEPVEMAVLAPALGLALAVGYWLGRDLLRTPSGFPEAMPAHGNRIKASAGDGDGGGDRDGAETGSQTGSVEAANAPVPDVAPEGESGLPASRRRQWWDTQPDSHRG